MDFRKETLADLATQVRNRTRSARELTQAALDRIDELNDRINAFVAVDADRALAEAGEIDQRLARGEEVGELAGIPIGVKDLEDAAGFVTTKGSAAYADGKPASGDSVLVNRLKAAGCVVVGKTNTPELGWKGDTVNLTFGATRNPWRIENSPGGSSGGTAAALAAGMIPWAPDPTVGDRSASRPPPAVFPASSPPSAGFHPAGPALRAGGTCPLRDRWPGQWPTPPWPWTP